MYFKKKIIPDPLVFSLVDVSIAVLFCQTSSAANFLQLDIRDNDVHLEETTTSRKWSRVGNIPEPIQVIAAEPEYGRAEPVQDTLFGQDEHRSGRFPPFFECVGVHGRRLPPQTAQQVHFQAQQVPRTRKTVGKLVVQRLTCLLCSAASRQLH